MRQSFEWQAEACERLGSPLTAAVCRLCAAELDPAGALGRHVLEWAGDPVADALPLRLAGALHGLVLSGQAPALAAAFPPHALDPAGLGRGIAQATSDHEAWMIDWLARPPQTNEVGRAAVLLPGFLLIARETALPLWLAEIGASAGLNLLFDRFAYRFSARTWGDAGSPVRLAPELRGATPHLGGDLRILGRRGADLAPLDASDPAQRLRLRAYVWPDQPERRARLDGALDLASRENLRVEPADAADWLHRALAARPSGAVTVVFHTVFWSYLPSTTQQHITDALERHGAAATAERPLAWLVSRAQMDGRRPCSRSPCGPRAPPACWRRPVSTGSGSSGEADRSWAHGTRT